MRKLNTIGHDFSRVQVGKGRFTYKCRLCFLRGERAFLKQLLGKPCSAVSRSVVPLPAPVSIPTPDEPESFFIGDTTSSQEDPFGWSGDFDQDSQVMSYQNLPLSPDKRAETVLDSRLSDDLAGAHMMEDAVLAVCAPGTSEVLCGAIERAESGQGHVEVDYVAAVDSRDFPGTMDYTRDDAAGASFDPGTASPALPRAHSGVEDKADWGPRQLRSRILQLWRSDLHLAQSSLETNQGSHQFGFRDATLWCWKCGDWSAGSRRASRLKCPCGVPTKTGTDVVYRVSGGFPPKARVWNSDDTSGGPERIPINNNPYSNRFRPRFVSQDINTK